MIPIFDKDSEQENVNQPSKLHEILPLNIMLVKYAVVTNCLKLEDSYEHYNSLPNDSRWGERGVRILSYIVSQLFKHVILQLKYELIKHTTTCASK